MKLQKRLVFYKVPSGDCTEAEGKEARRPDKRLRFQSWVIITGTSDGWVLKEAEEGFLLPIGVQETGVTHIGLTLPSFPQNHKTE